MSNANTPLTDAEIADLLGATLHGPPPARTLNRIFATLAEVPGLRAQILQLQVNRSLDAAVANGYYLDATEDQAEEIATDTCDRDVDFEGKYSEQLVGAVRAWIIARRAGRD